MTRFIELHITPSQVAAFPVDHMGPFFPVGRRTRITIIPPDPYFGGDTEVLESHEQVKAMLEDRDYPTMAKYFAKEAEPCQ